MPSILTRYRVLVVCLGVVVLHQHARGAAADIILFSTEATIVGSAWSRVTDATAAGGSRVANPNRRAPKPTRADATPGSYVELTFQADADIPYRLWIRGKAERDSYSNDSVFVQFSDSVTSAGSPTWRIGTTSSTTYILENGVNAGVSGWGWQDNGYGAGVLGPLVYFETGGTHTIRIQVREDGLSFDQVVLSPTTYLTSAPGATTDDTTILDGEGGGTTTPSTITLVREPYLQQVSNRSAIIVWASREPGPASARVGSRTVAAVTEFRAAGTTGMDVGYYQHVARVDGLSPSTTYPYDVFVDDLAATDGTDRLTTAPATGSGRVRFIAFGDSGIGSTAQRRLATLMADDAFDLALHTGDMVYGASSTTGDATYEKYHAWFFDIYRNWLRRRPMFPSNGNHDSRSTNGWGRAYLDLFVLPQNGPAGAPADHDERYYSFDYGPVHFVALDTEYAFRSAERAAQLEWLEADLQATTQPWKIVYFHRPGFSAGGEHDADLAVREAFTRIFERHGVQLVLTGHQHNYERTVPWREDSDLAGQAVTYYVTGGGGARLYPAGQDARTAKSASVYHYLRGSLEGCVATIDTVDRNDDVIDRFQLNRCDQAGDAAAPDVDFATPSAGALVSGTVTVEADASDDVRVEKVDLWIDGALRAIDLTAPYSFNWNTAGESTGTHTLQLRVYDIAGRRATSSRTVTVQSASAGGDDIVIRAVDIPASAIVGNWALTPDATAADGSMLWNRNLGGAKPSASAAPESYFDVTFEAAADTPYHLWLRMRAENDRYYNDSVYVWIDDATTARSVILEEGSGANVRGWGWNDDRYGGLAAPITFATGGTHTLRVGVREDGVSIDQIVLSPGRYLTTRPGALKDDATIVPR